MKITCLSKKQLAQYCQVSGQTIGKWLNTIYFIELEKLGYTKKQQILTPKQVEFIVGKLDIDIEEIYKKS